MTYSKKKKIKIKMSDGNLTSVETCRVYKASPIICRLHGKKSCLPDDLCGTLIALINNVNTVNSLIGGHK